MKYLSGVLLVLLRTNNKKGLSARSLVKNSVRWVNFTGQIMSLMKPKCYSIVLGRFGLKRALKRVCNKCLFQYYVYSMQKKVRAHPVRAGR